MTENNTELEQEYEATQELRKAMEQRDEQALREGLEKKYKIPFLNESKLERWHLIKFNSQFEVNGILGRGPVEEEWNETKEKKIENVQWMLKILHERVRETILSGESQEVVENWLFYEDRLHLQIIEWLEREKGPIEMIQAIMKNWRDQEGDKEKAIQTKIESWRRSKNRVRELEPWIENKRIRAILSGQWERAKWWMHEDVIKWATGGRWGSRSRIDRNCRRGVREKIGGMFSGIWWEDSDNGIDWNGMRAWLVQDENRMQGGLKTKEEVQEDEVKRQIVEEMKKTMMEITDVIVCGVGKGKVSKVSMDVPKWTGMIAEDLIACVEWLDRAPAWIQKELWNLEVQKTWEEYEPMDTEGAQKLRAFQAAWKEKKEFNKAMQLKAESKGRLQPLYAWIMSKMSMKEASHKRKSGEEKARERKDAWSQNNTRQEGPVNEEIMREGSKRKGHRL